MALAQFVATVVRGAVAQAIDAHYPELPKKKRGSLIGSIGKRAVNQLTCAEGEAKLRNILDLAMKREGGKP